MSGYVSYPISAQASDLLAAAYAYIKSKSSQWQENDGNLDTWILQIAASQSADLRTLATDVPDTIFRYFGASLVGLPPNDAASAIVWLRWTMKDTAGYTIPAGTQVAIRDSSGNYFAFAVQFDFVIIAGDAIDDCLAVAVQPGAAASGLGTINGAVELIDSLEYVSGVIQIELTHDGVDAETSSEYNNRLAKHLRRLSTRPVLADDAVNLALDLNGVARAVAIDGYNPAGGGSYNNEKYVAVSAVDTAGAGISSGLKTSLDALLQANREINFIFNVIDPNFTQIDVTTHVKVNDGANVSSVLTAVDAAIDNYLSPANWGRDPRVTDSSSASTWIETTTLRYNKLLAVIAAVEGVNYVSDLTIAKHNEGLGTSDITLTSPAALTQSGTISVLAA